MAVLMIALSACDKELVEMEESKVVKKLSAQDLELIEATNNLSLRILNARLEQNANESFLFSPVSVGMALGMIYNGVGQNDQLQIRNVAGLQTLAQNEINKSYSDFLNFIQLSQRQTELFYVNSIWFSYDLSINENYRTKLMAYYDAEISELNFGRKSTIQYINNWGAVKTRGHLIEIAKNLPEGNSGIYMINALGLHASWENANYFYTENQFKGNDGIEKPVRAINLDQTFVKSYHNDVYQLLDIPLNGNGLTFSVLQPYENGSIEELTNHYSVHELLNQSGNFEEIRANISMPDIAFKVDNTLKSTLTNIGLQNIFQPSLDLSPSFPSSHHGISEISQVTSVNIKGQAQIPALEFSNPNLTTIYLNRPFLYFVRDGHTKSVIFAGYYTNP